MTGPLVSVILPIYRGELHIEEAVQSILNQTYKNFELIVIDDCSPDNSVNVIKKFTDSRIKLISNAKNLGLIGALNRGIEISTGDYIARMDQDDISFAERLEKQVTFLEKNRDYSLVGTNYEAFGQDTFISNNPTNFRAVALELHVHNCICHPSVMFRAQDLQKYNLQYSTNFKDCEDYGLWIEIYKSGLKMTNLSDVLLKYRLEGQSTTNHHHETRRERLLKVYTYLQKTLFNSSNSKETLLLYAIASGKIEETKVVELNKYSAKLSVELEKKGFDSKHIKALITAKNVKISYSIIKRNWFEGLKFVLTHKLLSKTMVIYLLTRLKNISLSFFKFTRSNS